MNQKVVEKGFIGLPPNLLRRDEHDLPRIFLLIPGFNREARRGLATAMRSAKNGSSSKTKKSDTETILERFRDPGFRRHVFWREVGSEPPAAGEFNRRLYVSVDYWLLAEVDPSLDLLSQPDTEVMRQICPVWDDLVESMQEWSERNKKPLDLRYFSLWPKLHAALTDWDGMTEEYRWQVVNGIFALSSIAGDCWFVEEAKRNRADTEPYFAGLTPQDQQAGHDEETSLTDSETAADTEPPEESERAEQSSEPPDWQVLGAELRHVGEQLESGSRDPALVEELDELLLRYEQLKQESPLQDPAGEKLQAAFAALESLIRDVSEGAAAGMVDAAALIARWRAVVEAAGEDGDCERVQVEVDRAETQGRAAAERLVLARAALGKAADEHATLQAKERAATDWSGRRAARRALGDVEGRLSQLRGDEEEAEEALIAALEPPLAAPSVEPDQEGAEPSTGAEAVNVAGDAPPSSSAPQVAYGMPEKPEPAAPAPVASAPVPDMSPDPSLAPPGSEEPVRPEAQPEKEEPPAAPPLDSRFTTETGNLCAPIWHALRSGEVALAYQAASAIRRIEPDMPLPSPALLAAVALSRRLQSPGGPIAEALRSSFGEIDRNEFENGPEPWRLANNLLLQAACLRPLILAPDTGASGVAEYVHLGAGLEPVYEVQRLLSEYGQRLKGHRLDVAALGAVRSKAAWDTEFEQLQRDVAEWSERAPRFTVKFKAATDVWRRWINGDGVLARLTGLMQSNSASALEEVRELAGSLSEPTSFRTLVDETDRRQLKRTRGEDIYAGAFEQLRQKAGEAVALAERWISLIEVQPNPGDYLSRQLGELQTQLAKVGPQALEALDSAVDEDAWGLIAAARRTLTETLDGVLGLFAGRRMPSVAEPRPQVVLGEALLVTGRIPLDDAWVPEGSPIDILEAIKVHQVQPASIQEAFDSYVRIGDLQDARRLIEMPDAAGEDRSELERRFEREQARKREELRTEALRVEEDISLALAYSLIGEAERVELALRVAGLELGHADNLRFDLCRGVLEEIQSQISQRRSERAAELTRRLEDLVALHPEHEYTLVATAIQEGDFPVATEYLHRLEQHPAAALAPVRVRDLFNDFFPERYRQLQQLTEKLGATEIRKVIQERLNAAGVSFQHLSPERATVASSTWTQWAKLRGTRAPAPDMLRSLLLGLGFRDAVVTATGRSTGRIREYMLVTSTLSERDICQAPHFGSRTEGRYRIACMWDPPGHEDYRQLAGDATTGPATIAMYFGFLSEQKRRELSVLARGERRQSFLMLDDGLLLSLCAEEDSPLAALFQCALPFTYTDPFVTTSSVVPPEMFFGRAEELASIKSMDGRCFVYGGRQLGKTALLRQAEREFHRPSEERVAVWIDLKRLTRPDEIWVPIWRELRRHGILDEKVAEPRRTERKSRRIEDFVHTLEQWMVEHPKQRVLLLLDEADRFLEFDARDGFPDTRRLKALMEVTERRFKVVFAGLHNVLRTTEQANQPLAHFGEAIEIGPLIRPDDLRAARELVLRPLMAAGFAFESERRADRILALTNYYPSLIQLYCSKLLHELLRSGGAGLDRRSGPRYTITARHLDSVYARQDLRDEIRSKFLLTLKLDPRYNLITYALAYEIQQGKIQLETGASIETIRRVAESWWKEGFARTTEPAFRVLLQEMVGLGVLREVQPGRFTLRNPNVLLLLGSATEIGEELLRERELPAEYEPQVWRMAMGPEPTGPRRSPLSVNQVADVVAHTNGVVIVAGSEAAGVRDVQDAVTAAAETGFVRVMEAGGGAGPAAFHRTLDKLSDRKSGGTTVLFVGPDCPWSADWVRDAASRVERFKSEKNPVRVVFVADPVTLRTVLREGLPDSVPVVALQPWSDGFLREWLQELNKPFEKAVRDSIIAQTGGWPEFVQEWYAGSMRTIDDDGEAERRLGRLGVEEAGALSALDDRPLEDLLNGPDAASTELTVRWAELLGLLRVGADGKVEVDPYVAELIMRS